MTAYCPARAPLVTHCARWLFARGLICLRLFARGLIACLVCSIWSASVGCGNPCADLQEICDRCQDPNQKASCETTVDSGDGEQCGKSEGDYEDVCR